MPAISLCHENCIGRSVDAPVVHCIFNGLDQYLHQECIPALGPSVRVVAQTQPMSAPGTSPGRLNNVK